MQQTIKNKTREKFQVETEKAEDQVQILRTGKKLVVPEEMDYQDAITWIKRQQQEEEQTIALSEIFNCFPADMLVALSTVLARRFGWTGLVPVPGFFGPQPPQMVTVETSPGTTIQVPWGRMVIPGVDGYLQTLWGETPKGRAPMIHYEGPGKFKKFVLALIQEVRFEVESNSIYRGKAIRVDMDDQHNAKFLDLSRTHDRDLILSRGVEAAIRTSLFTAIEHTEKLREWGIPRKRGVLLSGPFGTGKTLTAHVTAKKAQDNGWTFIYLSSVRGLRPALDLAKHYQPCVLFAEDLDRVTSGRRDESLDDILNNLDGIDSKDLETIVVFTTNDVQAINPAMLRPGRLDAVIEVTPPDAEAAARLMRAYSRGKFEKNTTFEAAGALVAGYVPAVIREVVERAKLSAISRGSDGLNDDDLVDAALAMKNQVGLINRKIEDVTPQSTLYNALQGLVKSTMISTVGEDGVPSHQDLVDVTTQASSVTAQRVVDKLNMMAKR